MIQKKLLLSLLPLLVFTSNASAVSLVETKRQEGQDVMYVDGYRMLIENPEAEFRMIMDLEQKKAFMINPKNKSAMDVSEVTWKALKEGGEKKAPPTVDARLEKVGEGPEIAGYETTHYVIYVDGKKCADKWTSMKALEDSGFGKIWGEYGDFLGKASIDADAHPCVLAEYQTFRDDKFGMALKETDHNCETNEVVRIERNADFDRSLLEIPADYKVVKMPSTPYSRSTPQGHLQEDGTWSWGSWEGIDCSDMRSDWSGMDDEDMDEEYYDEAYADEDYDDEDYSDESYEDEESIDEDDPVGEMVEEVADEEVENLEDELKGKLKGFMNKWKKKD